MSSNASSDSSLNLTASDALNTLPQFDDEYAELLSDLPDINVDDDLQEEDSDSMVSFSLICINILNLPNELEYKLQKFRMTDLSTMRRRKPVR